MTGSSLAPIIIPIAGTISLAVWLIMVLSADGRPHKTVDGPERTSESPSPAALDERHQPSTGEMVPAGPAGTGSRPGTRTNAFARAGDLPVPRRQRGSGQKRPGRRSRRALSRLPAHRRHPHHHRREVLRN
jgi:hypothetical protein